MTPTLVRNFTAGAGGARHARLVRLGAADGEVIEATNGTEAIIGDAVQPGSTPQGQRVDVVLAGVADVVAGGTITRGAWLTATAGGQAVAAAPSAGANANVVGVAMVSAVAGDIFPALLAQHRLQG